MMDTEPPEGDDLQRLLVTMKREVLRRAVPNKRQSGRRIGVVAGVIVVLGVVTTGGAAALGLVPDPFNIVRPAPVATPSSATTSTMPAPTSTPTVEPSTAPTTVAMTATVPTTCQTLVGQEAMAKYFASTPLNDPNVVGSPPAVPKDALTAAAVTGSTPMFCAWRDAGADVSGLTVTVHEINTDTATRAIAALPSSGFSCASYDSGTRCQKTGTDAEYGVATGDTYFVRGNLGIRIQQSNTPTSGLLDDILEQIRWTP